MSQSKIFWDEDDDTHYVWKDQFYGTIRELSGFKGKFDHEDWKWCGGTDHEGIPDTYMKMLMNEYGDRLEIRERDPKEIDGVPYDVCCCGHIIFKKNYIAHKDAPHIWYQVGSKCVTRFKGHKRRVCQGCLKDFPLRTYLYCQPCRKAEKSLQKSLQKTQKKKRQKKSKPSSQPVNPS